jgi:oligopeptidase A
VVRHLEAVATYPELRAAYSAAQPQVSAFYSGIPLHAGLWRAVQDFASTEEAARLEGERRRLLTKTIDNFRRHGANLDPAGKQRLEALDVELSKLTIKFAENVLDSTNAFELIITDPAGSPACRPAPWPPPARAPRARAARAGASPCTRRITSR